MIAEILNIGTELLLGYTIDTNSAYISQRLSSIGIDVFFRTTVGDNRNRLLSALNLASQRSDIIITNGGLGPTVDDITFEVISEFTQKKLKFNKNILQDIALHFKKHSLKMPSCNRRQAYVPEDSVILRNKVGTAPGIILEYNKKLIIALPGPPFEMKPMVDNFVIAYLKKRFKLNDIIKSKTLKVAGLPESRVNEKVKDLLRLPPPITLGIYASPYRVDLRITAKAKDNKTANSKICKIEKIIRKRLKNFIFGTDEDNLEEVVGRLLLKNEKTISIAESCTGGLLANRITNISGSSNYFKMGVIAYSNKSKINQLNIPEELIKKYGAVSKEVALAMARNVRKISEVNIGIGITGIAGPTGATKKKPVGLVYVAISMEKKNICKKFNFIGDRITIKIKSTEAALEMIRKQLTKNAKQKTHN
ncbi:MAG: competence/damage-inducible protein A [Candidatus Omnitrophica bacterium]|nr:competence/damage-inducible protein A [Candidatus Omnitrophota bacterium]